MTSYLSKKMQGKTPYQPIEGSFPVRMDANESPYGLPDALKAEFAEAVVNLEFNRYPDPASLSLRKAFAGRYGVDPEHVVAGNGSDELINLIMTALLDKGDRLAVALPEFSMYAFYAELSENTVCFCPKTEHYALADLSAFVKKNGCRAVILSNPCNPTGQGFARGEVMEFVRSTPALCILDEAYMDFWTESVLDLADKEPNLIVLRTLSKAYGSAGLRIGFATGTPELIRALHIARSPYNVNSLSQWLGTRILESADLTNRGPELARAAQAMRDRLIGLMPHATVWPTRTNFVFIRTDKASFVFEQLLSRGIAVRCFGSDHLRISVSTPEDNGKLYEALGEIGKDIEL